MKDASWDLVGDKSSMTAEYQRASRNRDPEIPHSEVDTRDIADANIERRRNKMVRWSDGFGWQCEYDFK